MNNQVLEIVMCKLKADVSQELFLELMTKSGIVLKGYKGYLGRRLLYANETQQWVDLVIWASMEQAHKAAKLAVAQPEMEKLFSLLTDVSMQHFSHLNLDATKISSNTVSNNPIIEVLLYRLNDGIQTEDFRALLSHIGAIMCELEGFESRQVYYNADTQNWAEILTYSSQAAANQVAGKLMETAQIKQAFSMINEQSVTILFTNEENI